MLHTTNIEAHQYWQDGSALANFGCISTVELFLSNFPLKVGPTIIFSTNPCSILNQRRTKMGHISLFLGPSPTASIRACHKNEPLNKGYPKKKKKKSCAWRGNAFSYWGLHLYLTPPALQLVHDEGWRQVVPRKGNCPLFNLCFFFHYKRWKILNFSLAFLVLWFFAPHQFCFFLICPS